MHNKHKKNGFTLVEVLLAMVILAVLMTAVAVAFDASMKNYKENEAIAKTMNTARAALMRITNDVRTAQAVALLGTGTDDDPLDLSECSLITADGQNLTYRFDAGTNTLYLDNNTNSESYLLCKYVTAMTFNRPNPVRNVQIAMTVTDQQGQLSRKLVAAAVVRRNL